MVTVVSKSELDGVLLLFEATGVDSVGGSCVSGI